MRATNRGVKAGVLIAMLAAVPAWGQVDAFWRDALVRRRPRERRGGGAADRSRPGSFRAARCRGARGAAGHRARRGGGARRPGGRRAVDSRSRRRRAQLSRRRFAGDGARARGAVSRVADLPADRHGRRPLRWPRRLDAARLSRAGAHARRDALRGSGLAGRYRALPGLLQGRSRAAARTRSSAATRTMPRRISPPAPKRRRRPRSISICAPTGWRSPRPASTPRSTAAPWRRGKRRSSPRSTGSTRSTSATWRSGWSWSPTTAWWSTPTARPTPTRTTTA